jgi:hypothetical protein
MTIIKSWSWSFAGRTEGLRRLEQAAASTGRIGDGKIFLFKIDEVIRIRNHERGVAAL